MPLTFLSALGSCATLQRTDRLGLGAVVLVETAPAHQVEARAPRRGATEVRPDAEVATAMRLAAAGREREEASIVTWMSVQPGTDRPGVLK